VAGFGFGATIWVKLAGSWFGGLLNTTNLFGLPGVQSVFVIYGIVFALFVLLGSIVMVNPPEGYLPEGWTPGGDSAKENQPEREFSPSEMLRTPQFYMLWFTFIFSALAGLMVIYCIRLFGVDALSYNGVAGAGIIAGTPVRNVLELAGVQDILTKCLGSRNALNVVKAVMVGLKGLHDPVKVSARRGISVKEMMGFDPNEPEVVATEIVAAPVAEEVKEAGTTDATA